MEAKTTEAVPVVQESREDDKELLPELVTHLRESRTELREQWANRITNAHLLSAMTAEEIFSMATSVYDSYVNGLEAHITIEQATGIVMERHRPTADAAVEWIRQTAERQGVTLDEVVASLRRRQPPGQQERSSYSL